MNTPFLFEIWNQSHSLRGVVFVIITLCFFWALFYSKFNHKLRLVIKGILLVVIAICLSMLIMGGVSPENSNPLAILGIAIVCLSFMPKPLGKEGEDG